MTEVRISRRQLERLLESLSQLDLGILSMIDEHRFLTTRQIARFSFSDRITQGASLRAAHRCLAKLQRLDLLASLERRIGGVRAGSAGAVWILGSLGARLLNLSGDGVSRPRRRDFEPSTRFLLHTLAVAELHLRLHEFAGLDQIALLDCQLEPACWRAYVGAGGGRLQLKPDLAAVTAPIGGNFEDHSFFEVDLATEPPSRIVRKCLQYQEYRRTGVEQARLGIFPAVVWIAPTSQRRDQLRRHIAEDSRLGTGLFTVIAPDGLDAVLLNGPEAAGGGK